MQEPGSTVIAVAGMAFVILGLVQFLASVIKNNDNRRQELFKVLEDTKLKNLELQADRDKYKRLYLERNAVLQKAILQFKALRKERDMLKGQLIDCLGIEPETPDKM